MCLQDAGWKIGPWLEQRQGSTEYTTWHHYFTQVAPEPELDWRVSQEDIQVSLMWGTQKLQQIAQGVRATEQRLIQAEKLCVMAQIYAGYQRPSDLIDEAWRNLLLAQHHDCWIVPLHWHRRAQKWLEKSNQLIVKILNACQHALINPDKNNITVINTSGMRRSETVGLRLSAKEYPENIELVTDEGRPVFLQVQPRNDADSIELLFVADVPATSAVRYHIKTKSKSPVPGFKNSLEKPTFNYTIETDLYKLTLDSITGTIQSLITKKDNQELVDKTSARKFNEIKGAFYNREKWISSADQKNEITVLANGPLQKKIRIAGKLGIHHFVQNITLVNGQSRIDLETAIFWAKNEGIGDAHAQRGGYNSTDPYKAFYVDSSKLCVSFPLAIKDPKLFKDAPFDVTESALTNTFFHRWDQIKNNTVYRWVDLTDSDEKKGVALFTDHTTSYSYGPNFPLSLTLAYSGKGLWEGDYQLHDSTKVSYAIVPHSGNWKEGKLHQETVFTSEPFIVVPGSPYTQIKSIVDISGSGYELTSLNLKNDTLVARFYNAQGGAPKSAIRLKVTPRTAAWTHLDGRIQQKAVITDGAILGTIPSFGIRTLRAILKQSSPF